MLSLGDIEKEKPNELLQQVSTDNERASILQIFIILMLNEVKRLKQIYYHQDIRNIKFKGRKWGYSFRHELSHRIKTIT